MTDTKRKDEHFQKVTEIEKQYGIPHSIGFDKVEEEVARRDMNNECEMIMTEGDLDLRRNKEHLKAIRRGDVPETDIRQWAADKEKQLEGWYGSPKCAVPFKRREPEIKQLLMDCLEHHYGDLSACVVREDVMLRAFREVANVVDRHRNLLG